MSRKRTVVVGSGAGGIALSLLLARAGRSVTLLEIQPEIGGYLRRFTRCGVRFDTGYHFSGGCTNVMDQIMQVLGLDEARAADPIGNRIVLQKTGDDILIPPRSTFRGTEEVMCSHFKNDSAALHEIFDAVNSVWRDTPMRDLSDLTPPQMDISSYDIRTVRDFCASAGLGEAGAVRCPARRP